MKFFLILFLFYFRIISYANDITDIKNHSYLNDEIRNELRKTILNAKEKFYLPGISFSIMMPFEKKPFVILSGYESLYTKNNISNMTVFQVASNLKTFTANLINEEIKNNKISINEKIGKYFPQYPDWKNITIGQLINNTSGIFDYIQSENWWEELMISKNKVWKAEELLSIAYKYPIHFLPGTSWKYSNTNYVLLGVILEKITSRTVSELINELIQKSNLTNTFYVSDENVDFISKKMNRKIAIGQLHKEEISFLHPSWLNTAGALLSESSDLTLWLKKLSEENNLERYLSPKNLILKNTKNGSDVKFNEETVFGSGLYRMNTPLGIVWFTPGLAPGYTSFMLYSPCLNIYYSYAINKAPIKDFHAYMIKNLLGIFYHSKEYNLYLEKLKLKPNYCEKLKPSSEFQFPRIG